MRHNGAHLTRKIRWSHDNLGLCITLLLKIDKRCFDRVQLIFGIGKKASLPDFYQVSNMISEFMNLPRLHLGGAI